MSLGIGVEHPVPHVHTKNGLAEAFIKCLQLVTRTLVKRTKLPVSTCSHIGLLDAHYHPTLFCVTAGNWVQTNCVAATCKNGSSM